VAKTVPDRWLSDVWLDRRDRDLVLEFDFLLGLASGRSRPSLSGLELSDEVGAGLRWS
jgi:hypothetical protein